MSTLLVIYYTWFVIHFKISFEKYIAPVKYQYGFTYGYCIQQPTKIEYEHLTVNVINDGFPRP